VGDAELRAIGAVTKLFVAVMMAHSSPASRWRRTSARAAGRIIGRMRLSMNSACQRAKSSGECAASGRSAKPRYS
jgi:hypothetical protein